MNSLSAASAAAVKLFVTNGRRRNAPEYAFKTITPTLCPFAIALSKASKRERRTYSKSSKRERRTYSKSSKRERERGVIQNPAREREGVIQKPAREREGLIQNPARASSYPDVSPERERERRALRHGVYIYITHIISSGGAGRVQRKGTVCVYIREKKCVCVSVCECTVVGVWGKKRGGRRGEWRILARRSAKRKKSLTA